jgi:hypothetical protein
LEGILTIPSATHKNIMSTFINQYYQLFFDFLNRNQFTGDLYLHSIEYQSSTWLKYHDGDGNPIDDQDALDLFPRLRLYHTVAKEWWQLMAVYNHVREHSMHWYSPASLPIDKCLEQAAQERGRCALTEQGRWAELQPQDERELYDYLKQQLAAANYSYPTQVASYKRLSDLHNEADGFAEELNERIQRQVLSSLHNRLKVETAALPPRQALHLLHTCKGDGKHVDYTFEDGIIVNSIQSHHLRPFQFSGAWIELPDDKQEVLPTQLGFTDSRGKTTGPDETQSGQLTAQWCLEKGYQQLTLDPGVRNIVEEFGATVPRHPTKRWLSNGQLITDLFKCYSLLQASPCPVAQVDCTDNGDADLPF